jgi:RNA polymerase sigma-54 factor
VGIEIARRTVAKYREAMRIPSSVHRRRDKQGPNAAAS